jgi:hypothetical protein
MHPSALVILNNKLVQSSNQSNFSFKTRSDISGIAKIPVEIIEAKDNEIKKILA